MEFVKGILVNVFGFKVISYIFGIKFNFKIVEGCRKGKPVWSIVSCYPLNCLNWHWSLWWSAPEASFDWLLCLGFKLNTQTLIRK